MSRDSSANYIHFQASRHADLFEEFCRPPSSTTTNAGGATTGTTAGAHNPQDHGNANLSTNPAAGATTTIPGHYLPFEEINLPPHLQPLNPEDEDDVVPDMHAAFGINRALNQGSGAGAGSGSGGGHVGTGGPGEASDAGVVREPAWRDLGIEALVDGPAGNENGGGGTGAAGGRAMGNGRVFGAGMGRAIGGPSSSGVRREGSRTGLLLLR
ncbi:hypothetical protein PV10_04498 [Exophiala mesophila]|uniref:Uncharacterized protein n=1 Tax=Exophiala mesophila TaxID=212818 RepID=A0A0D1ZEV1_EXOME|nr:uncharacterized protein PV10_04498 [Exophiala mesophila]KIV93272.1 hypothetical protein PV10_04498 [Exophiala mesophila]